MIYKLTISPRQIAKLSTCRQVYVQLISGTGANISVDEQILLDGGGLLLVTTDGIKRLPWRGPLYVSGNGELRVEIV